MRKQSIDYLFRAKKEYIELYSVHSHVDELLGRGDHFFCHSVTSGEFIDVALYILYISSLANEIEERKIASHP